ncbi:MAG: aminotransferase class I/II-fold pyridoxal phosphate-dependent enzyme [Desulfobacteraceae bacterium]|nr:aminotransferase class I/II-fold pyridoxal phosphate-dependent enzyme [Desulfobacteraceae bacterium]
MIIGHGGNVTALAKRLCCPVEEIVDMSSNLNPLGPPEGFEVYIQENVKEIRSLPEVDAMGMIQAFSKSKNIDSARIAVGNGTTWFIYTLIQALKSKEVLICGPAYSDYKDACIMHNVQYTFLNSSEDSLFVHDFNKISDMADKFDTIFICNPNNPTAALIVKKKLTALIKSHPDTFFIVDESYLPFVHEAEELSLVNNTELANLIVLSSMSKIFSIPGLRTGFLTSSPEIINRITHYSQPWSINSLAQKGVIYLLEKKVEIKPFIEKTRQFIKQEREMFIDNFKDTKEIKFFPSETSFVLAKLTGNLKSNDLCRYIGDQKILIRDCSNFDGLSDRYVRFSLKTQDLNIRLVHFIKQALR